MEFSFDRSNETAQTRSTQSKSETPAASAASNANTPHDDGIDTSTIANERLRKAIERNRARQTERNKLRGANTHQEGPISSKDQASLFDKPQEQPERATPPSRPEQTNTTVVTRRSAARPNEADFTPVKRAPRKVSTQISYTTSGSRKKSKPLDPSLVGYLVKGCWIFCAVMILRLFFAHGGVTDYYSNRSLHNDRLSELDRIKKENMQLVREIERMQSDSAFQKKLVRDNLGFIAADEFLVLFPKESKVQ